MAHLWARWLRQPCRPGDHHTSRSGSKIRSDPLVSKVATSPLLFGYPNRFRAGNRIRSGLLVGTVATSPLPCRGSPPLQSGVQIQKWPTCGQGGYVTPAVSWIPTAAERWVKSEVAHLWARWLHRPCLLGDLNRFRAGGKVRSGPPVSKVATSALPSRGSSPLQSEGRNQKWLTYGQSCYVTPAVSGVSTASERGAKSEVAHLRATWLRHLCLLGDLLRFRAGGKMRVGPLVGKVVTSCLPSQVGRCTRSRRGAPWFLLAMPL